MPDAAFKQVIQGLLAQYVPYLTSVQYTEGGDVNLTFVKLNATTPTTLNGFLHYYIQNNQVFFVIDIQKAITLIPKTKAWTKERIGSIWNDEPIIGDEESFTDISVMRNKLTTDADFMHSVLDFRRISFGSHSSGVADAVLSFNTTPQPIFHKNFDLVSQSFEEYLQNGYKLYILSDVDKQTERIKTIFEDRGEDRHFTPVSHTIHDSLQSLRLSTWLKSYQAEATRIESKDRQLSLFLL